MAIAFRGTTIEEVITPPDGATYAVDVCGTRWKVVNQSAYRDEVDDKGPVFAWFDTQDRVLCGGPLPRAEHLSMPLFYLCFQRADVADSAEVG